MNDNKLIKKLKEKLRLINYNYHIDIYNILFQIYEKRQREVENYTYADLSRESTISELFDYPYIATIMQIEKITKQTLKRIDKGYFTIFEVASILRKSKSLQISKEQNKFFRSMQEKIKLGMTKKEFREEVTKYNCNVNGMKEENIWLLQTVYEIRTVKRFIFERYKKLTTTGKNKINTEVTELYNFIKNNYDKKYSLIPIHKDNLKKLREIKIKGIGGLDHENKINRLIEHYLTKDKVKCPNCKKTFTKKRKDQKFCHPKCKSSYNNKK